MSDSFLANNSDFDVDVNVDASWFGLKQNTKDLTLIWTQIYDNSSKLGDFDEFMKGLKLNYGIRLMD